MLGVGNMGESIDIGLVREAAEIIRERLSLRSGVDLTEEDSALVSALSNLDVVLWREKKLSVEKKQTPELAEIEDLIRSHIFSNRKDGLSAADDALFQALLSLDFLLSRKPEEVPAWEYVQGSSPLLLLEVFLLCHGQGYPCPSFALDWVHNAFLLYYNERGKHPVSGKAINLAKELGLVRGGHQTIFRERADDERRGQAAFNVYLLCQLRGLDLEQAYEKVAARIHEKKKWVGELPFSGVAKAYRRLLKKNKEEWDRIISKHRDRFEKTLNFFDL